MALTKAVKSMAKKIIILTIPGIGTQNPGYAKTMEDDLRHHTKGTCVEGNFRIVESRPFSVTEVDDNQEALYRRLSAKNRMGGVFSFRKFVMDAFGDGVAFERNAADPAGTYFKIHNYIRKRIKQVWALSKTFDDYRLIIVGHSMGCHLLSTYIWDADNGKGIFRENPATEEDSLENLDYLATIGCNIPLFVSGMREDQIIPFKKRNDHFKWDNFYDKDDILGWPMKQLSQPYEELVNDFEINTGLYIGSHMKYWNDNDFTKPLAEQMVNLFEDMERITTPQPV